MSNYLFSPSKLSFYSFSLKEAYEKSGSWPEDGVEVSDEVFETFSGLAPAGKTRGHDADGMPAWVDIPPPTEEERIAQAEAERQSRLSAASSAIIIWQTKLLMGRKLTAAEMASLNAWMDYIDALEAVDTSAQEIEWPEKPA